MTAYETDFYAWVHEQATLLAEGRFDALDTDHLVEELTLMADGPAGELYNRLIILLAHLLKLQVSARLLPGVYERAQRGWRLSCAEQRRRLTRVLTRNPSLRPAVPAELEDAYEVARLQCLAALQVGEADVPETCPWTPAQVLGRDFYPGATP
jgi:hypothetical protein